MSISLYERAGYPPHKKYNLCGTGILPVLEKRAGWPRHKKNNLCGTGILPVLENRRMPIIQNLSFLWNGHLARS
jgi:hypothetical protein